eukprot:GHVU01038201.1.p1 GENE.GHVU01038201.1~~GHVU01038201.1.p1  ORF type:complete len:2755 (-),score=186.31 GHVU01038201.1:129-7826(-)
MRSEFLRGTLVDNPQYESGILALIAKGNELAKVVYGFEKTIVIGIRDKLSRWHNDVIAARQEGCMRPATICILIASPSSYAKSTVMELTGRVALQSIGAPSSHEYFYTWPRHKHWNGFRSYKQCIKADDMYCSLDDEAMNLEKDLLMRVNNNSTFKPEMADLEEKANTFFDAKVLVGSANGYVTSKNELCRVANMRRWHIMASLRITDEFTDKDTQKVNSKMLGEQGPIPDAWRVDLYRVQLKKVQKQIDLNRPEDQEEAQFSPLIVDGKEMKDLSIREYLIFVGKTTREHFRIQKSVLAVLETFNREDIVNDDLVIRDDALSEAYNRVRLEQESEEQLREEDEKQVIEIVDNRQNDVRPESDESEVIRENIANALKQTLVSGKMNFEKCRAFLLRVYGAGATTFVEACLRAVEYWIQRNRHLVCAFLIPRLAENNAIGHAMVREIYRERIRMYLYASRALGVVPLAVVVSEIIRLSREEPSFFKQVCDTFYDAIDGAENSVHMAQLAMFEKGQGVRDLVFGKPKESIFRKMMKPIVGLAMLLPTDFQQTVQMYKFRMVIGTVYAQFCVNALAKIHINVDYGIAFYKNLLCKEVPPLYAVHRDIAVGRSDTEIGGFRRQKWFNRGLSVISQTGLTGLCTGRATNIQRLQYRPTLCSSLGFLLSPEDWFDTWGRQLRVSLRQPIAHAHMVNRVFRALTICAGGYACYAAGRVIGSQALPAAIGTVAYFSMTENRFCSTLSQSASVVAQAIRKKFPQLSCALYAGTACLTASDVVKIHQKMWDVMSVVPEMAIEDVAKEDQKKGFDTAWTRDPDQVLSYLDSSPISKPRNSSELKSAVKNSVWRVTAIRGTKELSMNCFALQTGFVLVPYHFVSQMVGPESWTFMMHDRGGLGDRSFVETISPVCVSRVYQRVVREGVSCRLLADAAIVAVGKCPPIAKAIMTTLPDAYIEGTSEYADIYYRTSDGKLGSDVVKECVVQDCHSYQQELYKGMTYCWPKAQTGRCMSPVCPAANQTAVVAFHTGTIVEKERSVSVCLIKTDVEEAIDRLKEQCMSVIPHAAEGTLPASVNGVQLLTREVKLKSNMARVTSPCSAAVFGTSPNVNRMTKTRVKRHRCYGAVKAAFPHVPDFSGPMFKQKSAPGYRIWDVNLAKVNQRAPGLPREDLEAALREFSAELFEPLKGCEQRWKKEIFPLTFEQAHDGVHGKRYYDSLNWQTSGGFGFGGPKKGFVLSENVLPNGHVKRELDPSVKIECDRIKECWLRGECAYSPYSSSLKDEPTKVGKEKVRTFQVGNMANLIVTKQLFAPAVRYLQLNRDISGVMVGMNPYSEEWDTMIENLDSVGIGSFIAIDYKAFDLHIDGREVTCFVAWVQELYRRLDFPEDVITMVGACAVELYMPLVDWNGDMTQLHIFPSGSFLTSAGGSFIGILRLIGAFQKICGVSYRGKLKWAVQGDDNASKVNWKYRAFNAVSFAKYLESYGIPVTSADKESAIKPRMAKSEVSFLKRTFRYCRYRNRFVGPLELSSIVKRLLCYMQTRADPREVFGQNVDGALMELSLHPKEVFLEAKKKIQKVVRDYSFEPFVHNLDKTYEWYLSHGPTQISPEDGYYSGIVSQVLDTSSFFSTETLLGLLGKGLKDSREPARVPPHGGQPPSDGYSEGKKAQNKMASKTENGKFTYLTFGRDSSQESREEIPNILSLDVRPDADTKENLQFMENEPMNMLDAGGVADPTRSGRDNGIASLGDFLSRPIKIADFTYATSSAFFERFDPWSLFLENPRVINRISNFKNLRGDLVVRILLNGNSFYYGRLLCSYQPLEVFDNLTANAGLVSQDLIQMSQYPSIRLNPTVSQTGEMRLPFLFMKDYVDISSSEWSNLGKLTIRQINSLQQTTGEISVTNTLPVTVYAYMENVSLVGLTATNPNTIVPQMDERELGEDGPVKKIATSVAKAAGILEKVPSIAPFAMPARVGAQALSAVAGANGWSAPSNLRSNEIVEPRGAGHTAVTDAADTAMKLTIDSKQETTIDPRVFGIDEPDALNIKAIASRESYLTTFDWTFGTSPDAMLWNGIVDPCIHDRIVAPDTSVETLFFPACCGMTVPFKYWTGSMKFRFEIVRSAYHKGRLAVTYDPVGTPGTREDNVNQTQIVDISTCDDFSVCLEPMQNVGPMRHVVPGAVTKSDMFGTSPVSVPTQGNGTVSIWVVNPLTLPNEPSTGATGISINVYVSCEDIELYGPHPDYTLYTVKPQMSETPVAAESNELNPYSDFGCDSVLDFVSVARSDEEYLRLKRYCRWIERQLKRAKKAIKSEVEPQMDEMEVAHGNEDVARTDLGHVNKDLNFDKVYFGESIESARTLMKRYTSYFLQRVAGGNNLEQFCLEMNGFPLYRGNLGPNSIHRTGTGGDYNYVATTLINYFACAYQVKKGSIRYKIITRGGGASDMSPTSATVSINYQGLYNTDVVDLDGTTDARVAYAGTEALTNYPRANGTALFAPRVNPVLEFEVPWYSQWRFEPGKRTDYMTTSFNNYPTFVGFTLAIDNDNFSSSGLDVFVAAGEDFTLNMFTGWPRMYFDIPPLP